MIDLRSDTITRPTQKMREAMYKAEVGDDVYGEDPTINQLETLAAEMLGKEAALFVTSGTQGNQIAVLTHCRQGDEIILDEDSHIVYYEGGAISAFAGVQPRTIKSNAGMIDPEKLRLAIRTNDIHFPDTTLICLENTHNRGGGAVIPPSHMKELFAIAQEHNVPIHLDGARLFNAAVALGEPLTAFTQYTTTVQVCLSKGLGAPVGSILAGSKEFIDKARKWRKRLGGGLRQAGILGAAGLIALTEMIDRLAVDHDHAKRLAEGISKHPLLEVVNSVDTNIVLVDITRTGKDSAQFIEELKEVGILAVGFGPTTVRFTTHYDLSSEQIEQAIDKVVSL
ncbi:low-specificity L-threonine aldolase [Anaerobacillus alkaliphilus]|uniref:Low-specificity L-threonine aldolase n=1 Tax=Anaerobacillus alkaliphilus TaxID=1548597 RepID=A0A4Q0VQE6_9BACI|nr:low-specificity L-threonine aldolase [Anaerobacillus alkaliphilus]RXI98653.1 low-specificity L-threonine aldolase [Anaerobacillus alkaliphilus]